MSKLREKVAVVLGFCGLGRKPERNKPIEASGQSDQISFSFGYENDQLRFCPKHFAHSVRKLRLHNPRGGYLVKKKKKLARTGEVSETGFPWWRTTIACFGRAALALNKLVVAPWHAI